VFFVAVVAALRPTPVVAQILTQRGFVEAVAFGFPQEAPNDRTRLVGGLLAREEAFFKPAPWIQFAGGIDLRADSHAQVEDRWRVDIADRGAERPRLSVRRASAAIARGPLTVDAGKQFIRWGKTDIITPTDRFAPRDFLNVVDNELLAVTGVRAVAQLRSETFEAVWVPRFTPSRVPLLNQRWAVVPADVAMLPIVQIPATLPGGSESGVRWSHVGAGFEYAASFFDGFNHLPTIDGGLIYPPIRMYGGDVAAPTRWFTIKAEAAYFTSSSIAADEYILYVVQIDQQPLAGRRVRGRGGHRATRFVDVRAGPRADALPGGPRLVHARRQPIDCVRRCVAAERRRRVREARVLTGSRSALAGDVDGRRHRRPRRRLSRAVPPQFSFHGDRSI